MPTLPPAYPGMPLSEVDTPALLIDLDAFERNLKRMADAVAAAGVRLRPHAKTHKSPIIALKQIALGAVGQCCQKVSEAAVMIEGGVQDVLVSNEVIGARKLDRLAALSRQARVIGCVDNPIGITSMAAAAERHNTRLDVLVEINVGASRCGVDPGEPAVALAQAIAREKNLRFGGLQAYQGRAQHFRTIEERHTAVDEAIARSKSTVQALKAAGLSCDIVGGAGTGTFELEAASGIYNELQAGSYIFMDADYARNKRADGEPYDTFEHALFVYATVMSMTQTDRAVIDAGLKTFTFESGPPEPVGFAGAVYERPSDEHGNLNLAQSNARPGLGDKVRLIPGHCDPTVNLHDWYVGIRGMDGPAPVVESLWPVAARGAVF
jgi:D-serine deaminase-like pyridoxal phosphate-dependent protein